MVLTTTFGQSQRWTLIRGTLGVENEDKNNFNLANKVFNRPNVLTLEGLNSGISLYVQHLSYWLAFNNTLQDRSFTNKETVDNGRSVDLGVYKH